MSKIITMISSDGQKVTIDEKSAERSTVLKGVIECCPEDSDVPMNVRGEVLEKVVEYLTYYNDSNPKVIQ